MTKKLLIKISAIALTVILAVVGIITAAFALNKGKTTVRVEQGNGVDYTEETPTEFTTYNTKAMKLSARTVSAVAATTNTVRLTATLLPSTVSNKEVDWTVSFVNPSSSWASGKNASDYVTVTPTSNGALTADVSAKQGFGEQVKITVTSRANAEATAYCIADYGKRLANTATLTFETTLFAANKSITSGSVQTVESIPMMNWQYLTQAYTSPIGYTPTYNQVYTKAPSTETITLGVKPTDAFYTALKAKGLAKSSNTWTEIVAGSGCGDFIDGLCSVNIVPDNGLQESIDRINNFNAAVLATSGAYDFEIKIVVNTEFESKEYVIPCLFNRNGKAFSATSASISESSIVL